MKYPARKISIAFCLSIIFSFSLSAQKKPLDHDVYDSWKSLKNTSLSDDGKYGFSLISEQQGNDCLYIRNMDNKKEIYIPRGYQYQILPDGKYAVVKIKAPYADTRQAKIKKTKEEKMPKDTLAIVELSKFSITKIPAVKNFKVGKDFAEHIAYAIDDTIKSKEKTYTLVVRHIKSNYQDTLKNVSNYVLSKNGKTLAITTIPPKKDTVNVPSAYFINLPTFTKKIVSSGKREYILPALSEDGKQFTFLATADSASIITKKYELFHYTSTADSAAALVDNAHKNMPANWRLSENTQPVFSKDGKRLLFGTAPIPLEKDTTIPDFEKAQLDIWHWQEPQIQPMQLANLKKEQKRTYLAYIDLSQPDKFIQLADETTPNVYISEEYNGRYALGVSNLPYQLESQWDIYSFEKYDIWIYDLKLGSRKQIKEGIKAKYRFSYNGNYVVWYNMEDKNYYSYNTNTDEEKCLTCKLTVNFWNEDNDMPALPEPYGFADFYQEDKAILVYDKYDIWELDPSGKTAPKNITNEYGRKNEISLRYIKTDRESKFIKDNETLLLSAFHNKSKERGYFKLDSKNKLEKLVVNGYMYTNTAKAKNKDIFLFVKGNFNTPLDLYTTKDFWKNEQKLTEINPQAKEYKWGTVELISWKTFDGKTSEGLLYKPEDFDETKKYPMITYFYERSSENLYAHYVPQPNWSIINISFFVSRGYVVFVPDIYYGVGHPGQDAYNFIVSGVEELCKNSWVDKENLGMQGQSWGGYQVAQLITKTNMFKCAGAGAPVSNMFSAYNGIRWQTGMSRQFQYEQTQSRIGQTMWEAPELYHENSPVFFADKVETPLLIMHNDKDGAVPWYQGIEYFMALRRLKKPVWMLQYNNEEHNLKERRNRKDLTIRLQQFFDYYLKGEPMPKWMSTGVPAIEKGINYGFEPIE